MERRNVLGNEMLSENEKTRTITGKRNYRSMGNHKDGHVRLGWTILLNIGITAAEVIGGLISGSLALLSDAGHNFSDVLALVLAYLGARGADLKPTKRSTYGFKRLEVVTALINALTLMAIAIAITLAAFKRYISPAPINVPVMLTVGLIGLVGNLLSVWILHRDSHETINNRAAFLHMFYDAVASVAVIVGGVVILFSGWRTVDPILSILIAMMILWSSLDIMKEAFGIFMEAAPKDIDPDKVVQSMMTVPGVINVHHLHIWSISSKQVALSCHITLSVEDCQRSPEIIRQLHEVLEREHGIDHVTIQPESVLCPEQTLLTPSSSVDTNKP